MPDDNKQLIGELRVPLDSYESAAAEVPGAMAPSDDLVLMSKAADLIESLERKLADTKEAWFRSAREKTAAHVKVMSAATDKRQELEAKAKRQAAVLEALTSDGVVEAVVEKVSFPSHFDRQAKCRDVHQKVQAALQHAQEQVNPGD